MKIIAKILGCLYMLALMSACTENTFKIAEYYPIAHENEWRYSAPEGWKDGDYISRIEEVSNGFTSLFVSIRGEDGDGLFKLSRNAKTYRHYDATKASKLLSVEPTGIFYHGETFSSDGSVAVFEKPIPWFRTEEHIGSKLNVKRNYTRFFNDGTKIDGVFTLVQKISKNENISTSSGNFEDCLKIVFDTYWDLGKATEATSSNIYYHAKGIGVVKASARFVILKNGIEFINRLVEPEMKSYRLSNRFNGTQDISTEATFCNIERIKIATVISEDLEMTKKLYQDWLNYRVVEEGALKSILTDVWGTPKMTGKQYALLQPESSDDVFLRVIQGTLPENYKAMTTNGWNAIEIIVEDPDAVYKKLLKSPFIHLDGPANLGDEFSTIRAVQFKGPSEEVFYFTRDTSDKSTSTLLTPRVPIDRPFIMVVGTSNGRATIDFYKKVFGAKEAFFINVPVPLIAKAQNLPFDYEFPIGLVRLGAFSNSIEIDEYPTTAGKRPIIDEGLPAGISMASFTVNDLDRIDSNLFISDPVRLQGASYNGNRIVAIIGPAGELIELIEETKD